jgi:hypothetical protein
MSAQNHSISRKLNEVSPHRVAMDDLPADAVSWSVNDEIAKVQRQNMYNAVVFTIAGIISTIICFKILSFIGLDNWFGFLIITTVIAFFLCKELFRNIRKMTLLNLVAIGTGHPWHPSEIMENNSVFVSDGESWHLIPPKVRVSPQSGSGNKSTLLKRNDMDGKIMLRWQHPPDSITRGVVSLINQALSFRDAQERDLGSEDPIERARKREELEFYPVERVWEETALGSLAPEPGALLRKMRTHSSEIIKKDSE